MKKNKKIKIIIAAIVVLIVILLLLLKSCKKETHTHSYSIDDTGTWVCSDDGDILSDTDKPYVAILENDQPKGIMPVDSIAAEKITLGNGEIYKKDNIIYYTGDKAQSIIIKTEKSDDKDDEIIINAPNDNVYHYGSSSVISLDAVATNSFHEFGDVELITLTKARIVLEKVSDVKEIYLDINDNNYQYKTSIIALKEDVELPKLTRDAVDLEEGEVKTLAIIQQVKDEITQETKENANATTDIKQEVVGEENYVKINNVRQTNDELIVEAFLSPNPDENDKTQIEQQTSSTVTLEEAKEGSSHPASANTFVSKSQKVKNTTSKQTKSEENKNEDNLQNKVKPSTIKQETKKQTKQETVINPTPSPTPTPTHTHSYGTWADLDDTYHGLKCTCGNITSKEAHTTDANGICQICGHGAEVKIAKDGVQTTYAKLSTFRDNVNSGNSYAGYTITLLKDVDLSSVSNWSSIGTTSTPFSGVFDGNNKTISNLKLTSTAKNQGLFGYVEGVENANYNVDSIWNVSTSTFSDSCISESQYTAVIKNLKLSGVDVNVTSSGEATGGLIGKAKNAYISNIEMINGTVKGYKQVGGVVGYLDASVIRQCSTSNAFNATLNDPCIYTVAGIVGTTRTKNCAVINCTNNAPISGKASTCMAGVVGQMLGDSNSIIYGCTNNGSVTASSSTAATNESSYCVGGVAGVCTSAKYVVDCTNTGAVSNTAGTCGQLSGIGCYRAGLFYNCVNSGAITGKACYVAGISGGHAGNTNITTVDQCVNSGSLTNTYDTNRVAQFIGTSAKVIIKNTTLQNADILNNAVCNLTGLHSDGYNLLEIDNVHFTNNSNWNYSVQESLSVKVNDNCDKPDITIGNVNTSVAIEGNTLKITLPDTSTVINLSIKGNNVQVTNDGTITSFVLEESSQHGYITNTGTIDTVSLNGEATVFNNGDSNHTTACVNKYLFCKGQGTCIDNYGKIGEGANTPGYNVLSFDSATGSIVNNYGIIYGRGNNANYAIGMEESGTVTFNLHSGSKLIKRDGGWIIRGGATDMTIIFNYDPSTIYAEESSTALSDGEISSISSVSEAGANCELIVSLSTPACLAAGTKITMADGCTKNIEDVAEGDSVLTFNHEKGTYEAQKVYLAWKGEYQAKAFTLHFDNGSSISIIGKHDLFEQESLKYVTVYKATVEQYIGKHFYSVANGQYVELTDITYETNPTEFYSIYTEYNVNCIADGMLSAPHDSDELLNIYKFNENLTIDHAQLDADIAKYGLYEFNAMTDYSKEIYDAHHWKYVNIIVGKGLATLEDLYARRDAFLESTFQALSKLSK